MAKHFLKAHLASGRIKVVVVGAGGTGSQVLTGLAQLHHAMVALGHPGGLDVTVIDDDFVSEANVGRQMFFPCDVGHPKATVMVNRINMSMSLDWKASVQRLTSDSNVKADLVIGCVDNRAARAAILQTFEGAYWLDIGNRLDSGQVILGEIPGKYDRNKDRLPHAADLFPEIIDPKIDEVEVDVPSCSLAVALEKQNLFVNRGVALYALNLLWELFRTGIIESHGVFVNMKQSRATPLAIDAEVWKRLGFDPSRSTEMS